ncbi:MAG: hydroxyisourate hydrolase [Chthoniobacterales bacterium]
MGKLSTHVLDTARGRPAAGMKIELRRLPEGDVVKTLTTNSDGRTDELVLGPEEITEGDYELAFHVGDYFGESKFLDVVPVRFRISDAAQGYHVPLLCTPWSYSTYRGS